MNISMTMLRTSHKNREFVNFGGSPLSNFLVDLFLKRVLLLYLDDNYRLTKSYNGRRQHCPIILHREAPCTQLYAAFAHYHLRNNWGLRYACFFRLTDWALLLNSLNYCTEEFGGCSYLWQPVMRREW